MSKPAVCGRAGGCEGHQPFRRADGERARGTGRVWVGGWHGGVSAGGPSGLGHDGSGTVQSRQQVWGGGGWHVADTLASATGGLPYLPPPPHSQTASLLTWQTPGRREGQDWLQPKRFSLCWTPRG